MVDVRDVRSQWDRIQAGHNTRSKQEHLPEGEYQVIIQSLKFFEANEKLPACLVMKLEVTKGDQKGKIVKSTNYFGSRKSILYWRTSIRKIVPSAFELNFDSVLLELENFIKNKEMIGIALSYSSNGNGKQYTNIKFVEAIKEQVAHPVTVKDEASFQEPF